MPEADACPELACPTVPTWSLELFLPETWAARHRLELEIAPGWDRATGGQCVRVTGRSAMEAESSQPAVLLSAPDCLAVPEPPPSALLGAGLVALVAWRRLRR